MWIKHVKILTEQGTFEAGCVETKDGRIRRVCFLKEQETAEEEMRGEDVLDGENGYLFPGMIDMHLHGAMGADFCDGTLSALDTITRFEASVGVTAVAPAVMTLPRETLQSILGCAAVFHQRQCSHPEPEQAELVGINMEGPFISQARKGAQDGAHIIPVSLGDYRAFQQAAGGLVKIIAVAPETAEETQIQELVRGAGADAAVAAGHSDADYDVACRAFAQGVSHVIHLFNAMPPLHHRAPGLAGAALEAEDVTVELICDGVHVHPTMIRLAFAMKPRGTLILVSDSMRAAGMPDGAYMLGGQRVMVCGNRAVLEADGALAGSVTTLPDCVRFAVRCGIGLGDALTAATLAPAKRLGIGQDYGSVAPGKWADLVLWDDALALRAVLRRGKLIVDKKIPYNSAIRFV